MRPQGPDTLRQRPGVGRERERGPAQHRSAGQMGGGTGRRGGDRQLRHCERERATRAIIAPADAAVADRGVEHRERGCRSGGCRQRRGRGCRNGHRRWPGRRRRFWCREPPVRNSRRVALQQDLGFFEHQPAHDDTPAQQRPRIEPQRERAQPRHDRRGKSGRVRQRDIAHRHSRRQQPEADRPGEHQLAPGRRFGRRNQTRLVGVGIKGGDEDARRDRRQHHESGDRDGAPTHQPPSAHRRAARAGGSAAAAVKPRVRNVSRICAGRSASNSRMPPAGSGRRSRLA